MSANVSSRGSSIVEAELSPPHETSEARSKEAVILTFGAPLNRDSLLRKRTLCEEGTRNVVVAMREHGVPRLVGMASIGAGDSYGHGRFVFRNFIEPVMLGHIMKDREAQESVIRESGLPG